jgi:hypothetical protein
VTTVTSGGLVHYPHNQLPRTLDRSYNPDRFAEMMAQQRLPPSTYYAQHMQPQLQPQLQPQQPVMTLTDAEKKLAKQLSATPQPTAPPEPIASYPHLAGSRDYLVNQIMGSDEKYDQVDANGNVVKTWNKAKLKKLGTEGLRNFIHENKLAVEPENKKAIQKEKQTKKKKDLLSKINVTTSLPVQTYQEVHSVKNKSNDTFTDKLTQRTEQNTMFNEDYQSFAREIRDKKATPKPKSQQQNEREDMFEADIESRKREIDDKKPKRVSKPTTKYNKEDFEMMSNKKESKPELIKKVLAKNKMGANGKPLTEKQLKHSRYTIAELPPMLS